VLQKKLIAVFLLLFIVGSAAAKPCIFYLDHHTFNCTFGESGVKIDKNEGDGATPIGEFQLREVFYRADRFKPGEINTKLPLIPLQVNDAWCDDVKLKQYNQHVKLPLNGSYERLWRDDHVYDIIVVIGYNDRLITKGKGSAIFLHIARENFSPTSGCVALKREDLLQVLSHLTPTSKIRIDSTGVVSLH